MERIPDTWSPATKSLWIALTIAALVVQGPDLYRAVVAERPFQPDFFQDWASARNCLDGLPVYSPHSQSVPRLLGSKPDTGSAFYIERNAHPPTSVLLAVPLAHWDYRTAHIMWDLGSLIALTVSGWLIVRGLGLPNPAWSILPMTVLVVGEPLRSNLLHGQLNCVLLLCLTIVWLASRNDQPGARHLAGAALALAAAIKIFPAYLLVYFLVRRQWRVMATCLGWLAGVTLLTIVVLGPAAYVDYLTEVVPHLGDWRGWWHNMSLPGIFAKLFNPGTKGLNAVPIFVSPVLAKAGSLVAAAIVTGVLVRTTARADSMQDRDGAFGLSMVAMLLVTPLAWIHSAVLLVLPTAWIWQRLPPKSPQRAVLTAALALLWVDPGWIWALGGIDSQHVRVSPTPWHSLTVLSVPMHALLCLFVLGTMALARSNAHETQSIGRAGSDEPLRPQYAA